jgi:signal transduction histidine kinase
MDQNWSHCHPAAASSGKTAIGLHSCCLLENSAGFQAFLTDFFREGLARRHKIVYICDTSSPQLIRDVLQAAGVAIDHALARGQIVFLGTRETYFIRSAFQPRDMLALIEQEVKGALKQGYAGFSGTSEMSWILKEKPDLSQVADFESQINTITAKYPCHIVCQFEMEKYPEDFLLDMIRVHPRVMRAGAGGLDKGSLPPRLRHQLTPGKDPQANGDDYARPSEFEQILAEKNREITELRARLQQATTAELHSGPHLPARVSHEIRNPLHAILGVHQCLLADDLTGEQQQLLSEANAEVQFLGEYLSSILDASRLESGQFQLTPREFDLRTCLRDIQSMFQPLAHGKGITFAAEIDPALPTSVCGDEVRVRQIFMNLIGNAVKCTEKGGVTLQVRAQPRTERARQVVLECQLTDTGIGIPAELHDQVFQKFWQGPQPKGEAGHGSGLGLFIVRKIVRRMKGDISFSSEPGHGTCFKWSLPLKVGACPRCSTTAAPEETRLEPLRILVVDDYFLNALVLEKLLKRKGHTVKHAGNGVEALDLLQNGEFDLVITDISMPEMDGLEFTAKVREGTAGPRNADIPILALTAHAEKGDRDRILAGGMNGYFTKPVAFQALEREIARLLG